ncbi:MAG: hypothetical protein ISR96_09385 [Nitrospira sp.]|nr:hypothetical protein [Nitrospira sp.]
MACISSFDVLAESTSTMRLSVTVVEDCIISNETRTQISEYSSGAGGAQTDMNFMCGLDVPYSVELHANSSKLYENVVTEDGFGELFHVEITEDGTYNVEKCDSLSDMPVKPGAVPAAQIPAMTPTGTGIRAGNVEVSVNW